MYIIWNFFLIKMIELVGVKHECILFRGEGLNLVASIFFNAKKDCKGEIGISKI